jgi:hypothetical protein
MTVKLWSERLLIYWIAEVLGENKSAAEERIDKALQRRKQSEPTA